MGTHSSILAWRIPGQKSLAGYSPWGRKESYMTEQHTHTHTHIHTVLGLQCNYTSSTTEVVYRFPIYAFMELKYFDL